MERFLTLVIILTKALRKVFLFLPLAGTPRHPVMQSCKIKLSLLHNKAISLNITNLQTLLRVQALKK